MAAGGFRTFVAGETLDEDKINDFLMQGILVFDDATARDAAITAPVEGQFAFLKDSDAVFFYDSEAWAQLETETPPAVVSGGNSTAVSGEYSYHVFTADGTLTVNSEGVADVLVISGGGGGGSGNNSSEAGGGGGAGGHLVFEKFFLPSGSLSIVVGAGGAGGSGATDGGDQGNVSSVGTLIFCPFGGGGLRNSSANGTNSGASGGGGGGGTSSFGRGMPGFGFDGGSGNTGGGGGGGAGAVGANSPGSAGGTGGVGTDAYSIWGNATSTGQDSGGVRYFSGGGGGGRTSSGSTSGGLGGGGIGSLNDGGAGSANTGGGGGGERGTSAGNGGSGLVIVRVEV